MMKYRVFTTHRFDKSLRRCSKRHLPIEHLRHVVSLLAERGALPVEYRPHKLQGYKGHNVWECHLQADWLLVWQQYDDKLILLLLDTGSHADLF